MTNRNVTAHRIAIQANTKDVRWVPAPNAGWLPTASGLFSSLDPRRRGRRDRRASRDNRRRDLRHWAAAALFSIVWSSEAAAAGFADIVVEYFDSGNGSLACPEGQGGSFPPSATVPSCVPFAVVLGDDPNYPAEPTDYLSLPMGSFITVGFVDEVIIDGEGDDLFIQEVGPGRGASSPAGR
jgi:hypothetical protein